MSSNQFVCYYLLLHRYDVLLHWLLHISVVMIRSNKFKLLQCYYVSLRELPVTIVWLLCIASGAVLGCTARDHQFPDFQDSALSIPDFLPSDPSGRTEVVYAVPENCAGQCRKAHRLFWPRSCQGWGRCWPCPWNWERLSHALCRFLGFRLVPRQ